MEENPASDSTTELHDAISKLEAYAIRQKESLETPSVYKTISLMHSILVNRFSQQPKKHFHQHLSPDQNEILIAIEVINRNRLFIERLREGTPAERELAEKFTKTISSYNESCDKRIQGCVTGKQRLINFFSKEKIDVGNLPKIALPKNITVRRHFPNLLPTKEVKKSTDISVHMSRQAAELFHMKVIALLERHGIASNPEARTFVKNSPIHIAVEEENASVCTLTQTLSLFPGQTITIKGNSALDPKTYTVSNLLPDTFNLILESTQTGFPHPIQRAGWTLASQLIPDYPQRIDLLTETAPLFQRRSLVIAELMQQGPLLADIKKHLFLKNTCFNSHVEELITLQKALACAILDESSSNKTAHDAVENFFDLLRKQPQPIEILAEVSFRIRELFISNPHQVLLNAVIRGKSTDLGSASPDIRYAAAKMLLDNSINEAKNQIDQLKAAVKDSFEQAKLDYMLHFGTILGEAAKTIILQYLSEDLVYSPPKLSAFECKVQTAAYRHLDEHLDEYKQIENDSMFDKVKKQILSDIELFKGHGELAISKELADYYHNRYFSLNPTCAPKSPLNRPTLDN